METNDLVSIIIPCYNQAQYLDESVKSAIDQTYQNIEIIIIDDGSNDNTEDIALDLVEKYPKKIQFISQKNTGVSEARNNAIRQSKGKYILPLDADDKINENMINQCINAMIENNANIVYTNVQCFGIKKFLIKKKPFSENNILYENLPHNISLYQKKVWEETNGYQKNMNEGYEDWEFWVNAYKHKFVFYHLSETLIYYRTELVSRDTVALKKYHDLLISKIILNHPVLYTTEKVQKAIKSIKETELLADFYFYSSNDLQINEKFLTKPLTHYLSSNTIKEKQFINIPDTTKKIELFALDTVEDYKHLKQLCKETKSDFILFYAPLRYEVVSLKNINFAWHKDKGMMETHGTIFPFVYKSKREDYGSQLIAYKRLVRYQEGKIKNDEAVIQEKNKVIEEQKNSIKYTKIKNETIMQSIQKVVSYPLKKSPIQKYKAYKAMIRTFYKLHK